MKLEKVIANWTRWGATDPMYAILTDSAKQNNRWDADEFFSTGERQIEADLRHLAGLHLPNGFGRAFDLGCGIGRLSQALAGRFEAVDAADISPTMIEQANAHNATRSGRVRFHWLKEGHLHGFEGGAYDLVYSRISLQHVPTAQQKSYLQDMFRMLKPGGVAFFQTVRMVGWRRLVPDALADAYRQWKNGDKPFIPMYGLEPGWVRASAARAGMREIEHQSYRDETMGPRFCCDQFCLVRGQGA